MDNERKEHNFLWSIENYSYCWHKIGDCLESPAFSACGATWSLWLYPRGDKDATKGHVCLFLSRSYSEDGPENISVKFELSVLAVDEEPLRSPELERTFGREDTEAYGIFRLVEMDEIFLRRVEEYLPRDTLTLCCKLWKGEGEVLKVAETCARTRIGTEKISYIHSVEHFSSLESNEKTVQIRTNSTVLFSNLYVSDGACCDRKLVVEIVLRDPEIRLQTRGYYWLAERQLYLLDASGNAVECGKADNRSDAVVKDIAKLASSLTVEEIVEEKSEYLPGDELTLLCENTFVIGLEFNRIVESRPEMPITAVKQIVSDVNSMHISKAAESPSIAEDLKAIYGHQCLTDVELKTKTDSFPAHKVVLAARSPVFKAMLTNDMKEKMTACVQVDDLEDDTVKQLLWFLYSDKVEDLHWKTATDLYYAADKYQIEKLKLTCASYLINNLCTSTAGELLLIADAHNDSCLKKVVEDFILKNEAEVVDSAGWVKLIEAYPRLVIQTMLLKYKRNK